LSEFTSDEETDATIASSVTFLAKRVKRNA
jgi:hypothetical protein